MSLARPQPRIAKAPPRPAPAPAASAAGARPHHGDRWADLQRGRGNQAVGRMLPSPSAAGPGSAVVAPAIVHDVLSEPGTPLPRALQASMQGRLQHDFGDVRIHADDRAAVSAKSVGAVAYTVGRDIVFDRGAYQPSSPAGQRLLAHELMHTVQQSGARAAGSAGIAVAPADHPLERQVDAAGARETGGAGPAGATDVGAAPTPLLQRQKAPGADSGAEIEARLQALFAEYQKVKGRAVPPAIQEWARKYEAARQSLPDVPPLDVERLAQAIEIRRIHNMDPPLPEGPLKLPPGVVGANDIFPFAKGSRLLVSHLIGDILGKYKDILLWVAKKQGGGGIADEAPLLIDLLTDPAVSKSVEATVLESSPTLFEAKIAVPDVPAKGARPAIKARDIVVRLEAVSAEPKFDLTIDWKAGRTAFGGITARRVGDKVVTTVNPISGVSVDLSLTPEPGGAVVVETEHDLVRKLLGVESLKLVRIDPLSAAPGTVDETKQKEDVGRKAATTVTALPSPHQVTFGASVVSAQGAHPMFSAGWRFLFRPIGDVVRAPFSVQLDYVPGAGLGTAGVSFGAEVKLPTSVPVTLSILPGLKAGAVGLGGEGAAAVFGPSIGARVGVDVGKGVNVFLGADYFRNVLDAAQKKDITNVPSLALGASLRL